MGRGEWEGLLAAGGDKSLLAAWSEAGLVLGIGEKRGVPYNL